MVVDADHMGDFSDVELCVVEQVFGALNFEMVDEVGGCFVQFVAEVACDGGATAMEVVCQITGRDGAMVIFMHIVRSLLNEVGE